MKRYRFEKIGTNTDEHGHIHIPSDIIFSANYRNDGNSLSWI